MHVPLLLLANVLRRRPLLLPLRHYKQDPVHDEGQAPAEQAKAEDPHRRGRQRGQLNHEREYIRDRLQCVITK